MGPLATADFLAKLVRATNVLVDQEHIPVIVISDPRIDDRAEALASGRFAELGDALLERLAKLETIGATAIAIPCNTAHCWYDFIIANSSVPIIHIADASISALQLQSDGRRKVTVWGTPALLRNGFYQSRLKQAGFEYVGTPESVILDSVMAAIRKVKAHEIADARANIRAAIDFAEQAGIEQVVLACSELPIVLDGVSRKSLAFLDTNAALAAACVNWWQTGEMVAS